MDDGSTDLTPEILRTYRRRVQVLWQENQGLAAARNALFARATGDLIAFLDADDIWHPTYLQVQTGMRRAHPQAVASFTGHLDFAGYVDYQWTTGPTSAQGPVEVMNTLQFFNRNYQAPGPFKPSFCCLSKSAFSEKSSELAPAALRSAEDFYMFSVLTLLGRPVIYSPSPLVAYRRTPSSLSANSTQLYGYVVRAFDLLAPLFEERAGPELLGAFHLAFASARRTYGKHLIADRRLSEAREEFWRSLHNSRNPASLAKSLTMLFVAMVWTGLGRNCRMLKNVH
jgi:glycosyltransferase involved in cell wall biosynthesis